MATLMEKMSPSAPVAASTYRTRTPSFSVSSSNPQRRHPIYVFFPMMKNLSRKIPALVPTWLRRSRLFSGANAGYAVHIGGLLRLDVEEASVDTIYLTVWASPYIPFHMGRIEHANTMVEAHFGRQLQPPIGEKRVGELGKWIRREYKVSGVSWEVNSTDVAAAGLGWIAMGLKGEAVLGVWCYDGVDITVRSALIRHRAKVFETAGFTVSKIVSRADRALNKSRRGEKKQNEAASERVGVDQSMPLDNPVARSC